MTDDLQSYWRDTFEPYAQRNLDHVALMQSVHPRNNMNLPPTYPLDHFHVIIGTGKFLAQGSLKLLFQTNGIYLVISS